MDKCEYRELFPFEIDDCFNHVWKESDHLQSQIYILGGVFGGVLLFLLIFVFALLYAVMRLEKKMSRLGSTEILQRHGYEAYSGKPTHVPVPTSPVYPPVTPLPPAQAASPQTRFGHKSKNGHY